MPARKPIAEESLHFADVLREALRHSGLTDPIEIGRQAARAQEKPQRADLPYHPAVVEGWLNGQCLPGKEALQALLKLTGDPYTVTLVEAHKHALPIAPAATEYSMLLQARLNYHGISRKQLATQLHERGICRDNGEPFGEVVLHYWCNGENRIGTAYMPAIDAILPPDPHCPYSLQTLEIRNRVDPAERLAKAAATTDIHRALRYIRQALHLSKKDMANEISRHIGHDISQVTLANWELLYGKETSALPSPRLFTTIDPISVYCTILTEHGYGDWAAQHKQHLNDSLQQAGSMRYSKAPERTYARAQYSHTCQPNKAQGPMLKPSNNPRLLEFRSQLCAALNHAGLLEHETLIGELIAMNQEPPREEQPYHPGVVRAWTKGCALPNATVFNELSEMLADVPNIDKMRRTYEAACNSDPSRILPESLLLLYATHAEPQTGRG